MSFHCNFLHTLLQAIVTPLSEYLMGWKELENSIAYCLIALEVKYVFCKFGKSCSLFLSLLSLKGIMALNHYCYFFSIIIIIVTLIGTVKCVCKFLYKIYLFIRSTSVI